VADLPQDGADGDVIHRRIFALDDHLRIIAAGPPITPG
jgi:hypothetical protein